MDEPQFEPQIEPQIRTYHRGPLGSRATEIKEVGNG